MFLLYYFRLKPTYWWINWWSVLLITSVVSNQMRARRLMTGRRTEYGIKWNILVWRKTSVLEEQALPTEDRFRNSLIGRSAVKNTWRNWLQIGCSCSKHKATVFWETENFAQSYIGFQNSSLANVLISHVTPAVPLWMSQWAPVSC